MLHIRNWVRECFDGRTRSIDPDRLTTAAMHRIDFSADTGMDGDKVLWHGVEPIPTHALSGPLVAARFRDKRRWRADRERDWRDRPGSYTGGEMPYTLVVRTAGTVDQCLRIGDYGPHARRWSSEAIGIAFAGDFTKHAPTPQQLDTAEELFPLLMAAGYQVRGHSELPGASGDPSKECPGEFFRLELLRATAAEEADTITRDDAVAILLGSGLEF